MTSAAAPAPTGERTFRARGVVDAERLFLDHVAGERFAFFLDAGHGAESGFSYLGTGRRVIVQGDPAPIGAEASDAGGSVMVVDDIGQHFREAWATGGGSPRRTGVFGTDGFATAHSGPAPGAEGFASGDAVPEPGIGRLAPGWVGVFGYEWRARGAAVTVGGDRGGSGGGTDRPRNPDAAFIEVTRLVTVDHATGEVSAVWRDDPSGSAWAERVGDSMTAADAGESVSSEPVGAPSGPVDASWRAGRARYRELVERCRASIARGDAYQLCLTNRISVDGSIDPLDLYRRIRRTSATHRGGLLVFGDLALVSASPERFLGLSRDGRIEVSPIKGTRRRAVDAASDAALADELRASAKERAENLMIVDLMRNDVGRVSRLGSVRVDSLFDVESYPHVHQLVSTVSGCLAPPFDAIDLLAATFPAGSMTGAPKQSAIDLLDALEGERRGLYAGAFGAVGADGTLDLSMVIRSVVVDGRGATIGTGGGITWSSDADAEVDEMELKARALLDALGAPLEPPA